MEEAEQSLDSKEDGLKNGTDPPDGAVRKVSTEIKNEDGNMREEFKTYEDENNSSEEFKAVVDLKEVKMEEKNGVKQIKNGEEDKVIGEVKVVGEKEPRKDADGEEMEAEDSHYMEGKKNLENNKDEEKNKEVEVQNVDEMKIGLEGKDGEVNRALENVDDCRDKKSVEALEGQEYNNDKYGLGEAEAFGKKSEEKGSNPRYDKSAKELENDRDGEGVKEMKDDEHGKTTSGDKDEESVLVQVEARGKDRKEAKDMEMCGAEDVVEKEAADVKDEGKLVVREGEEVKKYNGGNADKTVGDNETAESLKRKRGRAQTPSEAGEANKNGGTKENVQETEVKGSRKKSKEVLSSPVVSSSDRPVRERKTVERLVEVIEDAPDRAVIIEKGRGTPLIEIPKVAYNLARKKPAELKFLHQTLFGRKGKAVDFRSNLLQFSGFTWHESEEKQRAKIKEKLDKCVKETLLELCDLLDLTVSKANTKKDEIIVKLLDFMEAPQAMGDAVHAEKQSSKSRKRERTSEVDASKGSGGNFEKKSRQKHDKTEGTPNSDIKKPHDAADSEVDEEEDSKEQSSKEDEVRSHSKSDEEEKELEETGDEEEDESEVDADLRKRKLVKKSPKGKENKDVKKYPKTQASSDTVKRKIGSNFKKKSPNADGKSSLKTPPYKQPNAEKSNDTGEKALSREKKDDESPKKANSTSKSKKKSSGKASKSKAKSGKVQKSGPTKAELKKSICEILKEVDFNTATFTDILEQLASEYKVDLTPRKAVIKLMVQDELTKLADEEEESEDEEMQ